MPFSKSSHIESVPFCFEYSFLDNSLGFKLHQTKSEVYNRVIELIGFVS